MVLACLVSACGRHDRPESELPPPAPAQAVLPPPSALARLRYPSAQDKLLDPASPGAFQHTGAGNPESGRFGSVRTGANGYARFHEGIDITSVQWDARGRPLDTVHAAAPGTVAFVNRVAGNSNYGKYVVLMHDDPVGRIYTLYAHLAETGPGLAEGQTVEAGDLLGRIGNTAVDPIPLSRSHLHFEIGLLANDQFLTWPGRKQKNTPGGLFNGQNLLGVDPVEVLRGRFQEGEAFSMLQHLHPHPVAFELLVRTRKTPPFFEAHPALWDGEPYRGEAMVLSVSEGGLPLRGRNATAEEIAATARASHRVLMVDPRVLGRNGRRHVVNSGGRWVLGQNGVTWLDILTHPGGLQKP